MSFLRPTARLPRAVLQSVSPKQRIPHRSFIPASLGSNGAKLQRKWLSNSAYLQAQPAAEADSIIASRQEADVGVETVRSSEARAEAQSQSQSTPLSQHPAMTKLVYPGAVNSKIVTSLSFDTPENYEVLPTYRMMSPGGFIIDKARSKVDVSAEEIISWYRNMIIVQTVDFVVYSAQRQSRLSFYMSSSGEEALAIGSGSALHAEDVVFAQYREAGVYLQRGFDVKMMMAQCMGNNDDLGRGRNMPVHYGSAKLNHHTISSPLATQLPQASGAAYALKLQAKRNANVKKRVVACYFGDGAASEGDFHAALNMAATRACPVIFFCRNNGIAISTTTKEQYRGDGIAIRGIAYGMKVIRVDGNDIFATREATKEARRLALEDGGQPVLIEAMTYRASHHSTSDDYRSYRSKDDVETWQKFDNPVTRLRKYIENHHGWNAEKEEALRKEVKKMVFDELHHAEKGKKPPLREMFTDVYEEITPEIRSQMDELRGILDRYPDEYDVDAFTDGKDSLRE